MDLSWVTGRDAWEDKPVGHSLLPSGKGLVTLVTRGGPGSELTR